MTAWRRAARLAGTGLLAAAALVLVGCASDSSASRTIPADQAPRSLRDAIRKDPGRYQAAVKSGARFVLSSNGKGYSIQWAPPGKIRGTLVTLHGDKSTAVDQFILWKPLATRNHLRIVSVQWTYGIGQGVGRYQPGELYAEISRILGGLKVRPGTAILHGFSTAALRTYALAAADRRGHRWFGLDIANSGSAFPTFPPNAALRAGTFGRAPLRGSRWVLFCGGHDPNPQYTGCPSMRRSAAFIRSLGGTVAVFIADPRAGHAGFLGTPANAQRGLDAFRPA